MKSEHVKALKLAGADEWDEAHRLIQELDDPTSCLIHGYLHRVEGDLANAAYWYRRAGEPMPDNTLQQEFTRLSSLS